jgi:hypothetical protein
LTVVHTTGKQLARQPFYYLCAHLNVLNLPEIFIWLWYVLLKLLFGIKNEDI